MSWPTASEKMTQSRTSNGMKRSVNQYLKRSQDKNQFTKIDHNMGHKMNIKIYHRHQKKNFRFNFYVSYVVINS